MTPIGELILHFAHKKIYLRSDLNMKKAIALLVMIMMVLGVATMVSAAPATDGLVLHYSFVF
jgi:hypothetical protein